MAKGLNRIALYELVNKARFKSAQQKALAAVEYRKTGQLPAEAVELKPEPAAEKAVEKIETPKPPGHIREAAASKPGAVWGTKPKAVRLSASFSPSQI